MKIETTRFGRIEVCEDKVLFFLRGLIGFEDLRRFVVLPLDDNPYFVWLQSAEEPQIAFLLADPFVFFQGYELDIPEGALEKLKITERSQVLVQVISTIPQTGVADMTANLVGPVIINTKENLGMQVILSDSKYGARHPLFKNTIPGKCGSAAQSR